MLERIARALPLHQNPGTPNPLRVTEKRSLEVTLFDGFLSIVQVAVLLYIR